MKCACKDHQNIDCHYFASNLVVERVPCDHLDNISPKGNIRQAANIDFLLNQEELHHLREEYKIIVGRVLVEFIPELRFLKTVIPNHISHQYSNEMSTIIPLPILFKDEKKYDDSSIGDGGSGPCCAKNPTQKNVPKTPPRKNPEKTGFNHHLKIPKVKWETTKKNRKKPVLIGKIGKMGKCNKKEKTKNT